MKEKLTLSIEKETKERAKRYARRKGTSVSKMVEAFLASISGTEEDPVLGLGEHPVKTGVSDASVNHDRYINKSDK